MQALIKTMLNSPTADQGGYSNIFSVADLKHLAQREPKLMVRVKEANESIVHVDTFLKAYGNFQELDLLQLVSTLEVRCVMHAWGKKAESRASYANFRDIMAAVMCEATLIDSKLPKMPLLADRDDASKKRKADDSGFRQVMHGKISDDALEARGFKVGAMIQEAKTRTANVFKITKMNTDGATITILPIDAKSEKHEQELKRTALVGYVVVPDDNPVFITTIRPLSENLGMIRSIVEGAVKQVCMKEMYSSAEDHCSVAVHGRELRLHASKKFNVGKLCLYPVSPMVALSEKAMDWALLGDITIASKKYGIYMKAGNSSLVKPDSKEAKAGKTNDLISKFYIASSTSTIDTRIANAAFSWFNAEINVVKSKVQLTIPVIENTKEISANAAIYVLSESKPAKKL